MDEKEIYNELNRIYKEKENWLKNIDVVVSYLLNESIYIKAKVLWIIGEIGLIYPEKVEKYIDDISVYMKNKDALLRERAVNALGRIGRAKYELIIPYIKKILSMSKDVTPSVRMNFIWACENIATNSPFVFKDNITIFAKLLNDSDLKVRIEAPEIFRVIGKREKQYVIDYIDKLKYVSENDENRVVRIHALGAIKAILS